MPCYPANSCQLVCAVTIKERSRCPADYRRYTQDDVRGGAQPYFLGGRLGRWAQRQPDEPHWVSFCSVEDTGPVCQLQQGNKTVQDLVALLFSTGESLSALESRACSSEPKGGGPLPPMSEA